MTIPSRQIKGVPGFNPDPRNLRNIIEEKGYSQVLAAKCIGVAPRQMRRFLSFKPGVYRAPPLWVQWMLEALPPVSAVKLDGKQRANLAQGLESARRRGLR